MATGPLRPSDIKASIYGTTRSSRGVQFQRILDVGWEFEPSIGIVAKQIDKLGLDLQNTREPLVKAIRLVMMPSIKKNFIMEGRPDPWEPLAPYTEERRGGKARPILYRTGLLERTASSFGIWSIGADSAAVKKLPRDVWYGNIHQAGYGSIGQIARKELGAGATRREIAERSAEIFSEAGTGANRRETKFTIPQREFIMFQEQDIEDIQDVFIEWMEDKAEQVGRGWNRL